MYHQALCTLINDCIHKDPLPADGFVLLAQAIEQGANPLEVVEIHSPGVGVYRMHAWEALSRLPLSAHAVGAIAADPNASVNIVTEHGTRSFCQKLVKACHRADNVALDIVRHLHAHALLPLSCNLLDVPLKDLHEPFVTWCMDNRFTALPCYTAHKDATPKPSGQTWETIAAAAQKQLLDQEVSSSLVRSPCSSKLKI